MLADMNRQLASEQVVVEAPMSYTGSARRLWRKYRGIRRPVAPIAIVLAWVVVTAWYVVFGVLVIPYRLLRRGHRKERRAQLRHQEALDR
jgi:hypothetical protein